MKILLLEDDRSIRELVAEKLEKEGFEVFAFRDGESALDSLLERAYDLMLLDISVPKMDGYEFLKVVREGGVETPAIIVTAHGDMEHLEKGYALGCNDFVRKPFSLKELILRVRALVKNHYLHTSTKRIELMAPYSFCPDTLTLFKGESAVELTGKERLFISLLIRRRGQFVPMETILEYVWEGEVNSNNLRTLVCKLRKKLPGELIMTNKGQGYQLA